jgi:hypothetical protein
MDKKPPLGYPGNPVIGVGPPPGTKWKILGKWDDREKIMDTPDITVAEERVTPTLIEEMKALFELHWRESALYQ